MELKAVDVPAPPQEGAAPPVEKRVIQLRPPKAAPQADAAPKGDAPAQTAAPVAPATGATTGGPGDKPTEKPAEAKAEDAQKPAGREFAALKRERHRAEQAKTEAATVLAEANKYREAIASNDPRKIMAAFGLTDEAMVDLYINAEKVKAEGGEKPADDENSPLAQKLKELQARIDASENARQETEARAGIGAAVARFETAAGGDKERWAAVNDAEAVKTATGGQYTSSATLAFDVAWERFQATGERLSVEDALDHVEEFLISEQLRRATPDVKARRALLASLNSQPSTVTKNPGAQASASPAATGVVQRTNVNNSASSVAAGQLRGPTRGELADRKFFERVAALARGSG